MHPWTFLAPPSLEYLSGNLFPFSAHARLKYASPLSSMLQFNFTLPPPSHFRGGALSGGKARGLACGQGVTNECTCQHCKPPSFNLLRAGVYQPLHPPPSEGGKTSTSTYAEELSSSPVYYYRGPSSRAQQQFIREMKTSFNCWF